MLTFCSTTFIDILFSKAFLIYLFTTVVYYLLIYIYRKTLNQYLFQNLFTLKQSGQEVLNLKHEIEFVLYF